MPRDRLAAAVGATAALVALSGLLAVMSSNAASDRPDRLVQADDETSPSPTPSASPSPDSGALACDDETVMGFLSDYDTTGSKESTPREALAEFLRHTYRRGAEYPERFTERVDPAPPNNVVFDYRDDSGQVRAQFWAATRDGVSFIESGRICQSTARELSG